MCEEVDLFNYYFENLGDQSIETAWKCWNKGTNHHFDLIEAGIRDRWSTLRRVKNLIAHRRRSHRYPQRRRSDCCGWCGRRYDVVLKAPKKLDYLQLSLLHHRGSSCRWRRNFLSCSDGGSIGIHWRRRQRIRRGSDPVAAAGMNAESNCRAVAAAAAAAAGPDAGDHPLPANSPTPISTPILTRMLRHCLRVDRYDCWIPIILSWIRQIFYTFTLMLFNRCYRSSIKLESKREMDTNMQ